MTIKEKGYAHWDGELVSKRFPWWPIMWIGIKLTFKKKFFRFFFFMTFIPAVVFLGLIYVSERLGDFQGMLGTDAAEFLKIDPGSFNSYFSNNFFLFLIIMILLFCGAGLISDDLKFNSLQLYFSRPISRLDYIIGKAAVIVFFMLFVTLVPGLLFFLMKIVFAGNFKFFTSYPWLPLSVIGYAALLMTFYSFYTLFLSSIGKNRRYAAIMIFGIYFFSDILYGIFNGIFRNPYFSLISIKVNIQQVSAVMFGQEAPNDIPWLLSLLVLAALCTLAGFVLKRKVKGVEIVK